MTSSDDGTPAVPDATEVAVEDADGRANEIGGRSGRESRLDLLLAEELAADHEFTLWFLLEALKQPARQRPEEYPPLPGRPPEQAEVRLNVMEDLPPIPADAHGETDIAITLKWEDGYSLPVVVEDKVWSPFQPCQPKRCADRAESRAGVAVLVAPKSYIRNHLEQAKKFHGYIAIEQIIERLRSSAGHQALDATSQRRRDWRAQVLTEIIRRPLPPPDDPPTVEFTTFCVKWFEGREPLVIPNERSCHTTGQGWLWFESPKGLGYKASGWAGKQRAGVDLYVKDHGFTGTAEELDALLQEVGCPEGFTRTQDTAKTPNLVLRYECAKVYPFDGPPDPGSQREKDIVDALDACHRAAAWLEANKGRLATAPARPAG
jgi:hypothetical protein